MSINESYNAAKSAFSHRFINQSRFKLRKKSRWRASSAREHCRGRVAHETWKKVTVMFLL